MSLPQVTETDVRMFLMDYPEANTLSGSIRWSSDAIQRGLINCVDKFNLMNPPIGTMYTVESFPFRHLLLLGTAAHLLKSLAVSESLNQYQVQGEGIAVSDRDKGPVALQLAQTFDAEFKELAGQIRMNINIGQVFGTVHSEYIQRVR